MTETEHTPKILVGTAGWSYKDWTGVFYPPELQSGEWLQYYSRFFNVIEVNSTYYARTSPRVVEGWVRKTEAAEDFAFILKLHQSFTHQRTIGKEELSAFLANLEILRQAGRLCGILLQFPYSFDNNTANVRYLDQLEGAFAGYTQFLEVRHKSWLSDEGSQALREKFALCAIDQPQIGQSVPFHIEEAPDKVYLRLHGRNVRAWKESISSFGKKQSYEEQSERYNYLYSRGELIEIAVKLKEKIEGVKEVVIITNNHPHGNAVMNAFELIGFLKLRIGEGIPENTKKRMRELSRTA